MGDDTELLDGLGIAQAVIRLERSRSGAPADATLVSCNRSFVEQTSVSRTIGTRFLQEAFGADSRQALAQFAEVATERPASFPAYYRSSSRWFSCFCRLTGDDLLALVLIDVTSFKSEPGFVQMREQAYRSFIEQLPMIAILRVISPQPILLFSAGAFRDITGYGPEQGGSIDAWLEIVHPEDVEMVREATIRLVSEPECNLELEYRIVRRDGRTRWVRSYDRHYTMDEGAVQIVQVLVVDITDRKQQEEALREANARIGEQNKLLARLARTDALTGMLNRRAMQEQLEREILLMSRGGGSFSILLIDLDDFKGVNDRYGHRAGDQVLIHLSRTLSGHLRVSDVQARWGGEEFMVLFSGTGGEAALNVANKLRILFADNPAIVDGQKLTVTFTGGLVEATEQDTVDTLFVRADTALYQGKNAGRNRIVGILSSGATVEKT